MPSIRMQQTRARLVLHLVVEAALRGARLVVATALLGSVPALAAPDRALSLRSCDAVPDTPAELAQLAAHLSDWLGCYHGPVQDSGWSGMVFDRGVLAETSGPTRVRLVSHSARELIWTVVVPLDPLPGNGSMQQFAMELQNVKAVGQPGGIATWVVPPPALRAQFKAGVQLIYSVPGTDYDWDQPIKLSTPGVNGSTVPLPYGLDPARVPVAGSYVTGPQQESLLTSAWYELPRPDGGHPLVVVTAAGKLRGERTTRRRVAPA